MSPDVDDAVPGLPPIDGDEGEAPAVEEDDLDVEEQDRAGLDDAESGELDTGSSLDAEPVAVTDDDDGATDIGDVGAELAEGPVTAAGDDAPGIELPEDEDFLPEGTSHDDAAEGTSDVSIDIDESELPPIDDDGGELGDEAVAALPIEVGVDAAGPLRWADAAFEVAGEPAALEGLRGGAIVSLALDAREAGGAVFVSTERGGLFRSRDRGTTVEPAAGWRAHIAPPPEGSRVAGPALATGSGTLAVLAETGRVATSLDGGDQWDGPLEGPDARAIAIDDAGTLYRLTFAPGRAALVAADASGGARLVALEPFFAALDDDAGLALAVSGRAIAIASERGAWVSRDGGEHFAPLTGSTGARCIAFEGKSDDAALLIATQGEAHDATLLLRARPGEEPVVVSDLAAAVAARGEQHVAPSAMAWDDVRGVAWVALGARVLALRPPLRAGAA